jgi:hypothetical protein
MLRVEFEPTIPVFERLKTVYALDRAAIETGNMCAMYHKICTFIKIYSFFIIYL